MLSPIGDWRPRGQPPGKSHMYVPPHVATGLAAARATGRGPAGRPGWARNYLVFQHCYSNHRHKIIKATEAERWVTGGALLFSGEVFEISIPDLYKLGHLEGYAAWSRKSLGRDGLTPMASRVFESLIGMACPSDVDPEEWKGMKS